jgi:hypothetical protein
MELKTKEHALIPARQQKKILPVIAVLFNRSQNLDARHSQSANRLIDS